MDVVSQIDEETIDDRLSRVWILAKGSDARMSLTPGGATRSPRQ